MLVALGNDHRGLELKQSILSYLIDSGYRCNDFGCYDTGSVDYPDIAKAVAAVVSSGDYDYGILICGTGIGMSIAANKIGGVRAALCRGIFDVQRARQHNDANILCLGQEITVQSLACEMTKYFLATSFDGGRHLQRLKKIHSLETYFLDNK